MPPSEETRQEWAKAAQAKVAAAQETLAAEVAAICSGDDWRRYLGLQAKLHCYSPNNVMLIATQHAEAFRQGRASAPEPSYVAGFKTWRALGRSVSKGQHGYGILAPCRYDRRVALDAEGNARPLGKTEAPAEGESVEARRVLAGFRVEHVFDLSQTTGADLPEPPRPALLEGEAPGGLRAAVVALMEDRGFGVGTVPDAGAIQGANGRTDWASRSVVVRSDMDEAAMVKTLIHEAAHVVLHEGPPGRYLPRATKEVEAESVAYVVAAAHGMATEGYSFPYVAAWAGEEGAKAVSATQSRVATASRQIIDASPAPHVSGGRAPGAEAAIASARSSRPGATPQAPAEVAAEPAGVGL